MNAIAGVIRQMASLEEVCQFLEGLGVDRSWVELPIKALRERAKELDLTLVEETVQSRMLEAWKQFLSDAPVAQIPQGLAAEYSSQLSKGIKEVSKEQIEPVYCG